jgi:hypothetical protein
MCLAYYNNPWYTKLKGAFYENRIAELVLVYYPSKERMTIDSNNCGIPC